MTALIVDVGNLTVTLEGPARGNAGDRCLLERIDLRMTPGDFVEVRGHSGSGKTTLLQALAGIRPGVRNATVSMEGRAIVAGVDVISASQRQLTALRRDRVTYIPQFSPILGALSVAENIELPYLAAGLVPRSDRIVEALAAVALEVEPDQRAAVLSGGEQRRLSIAATLVAPHPPQLVIVDEPTAGLGANERHVVLGHLRSLADEHGVAVISATHEDQIAERALTLAAGRVVRDAAQLDPQGVR